MLEIHLLFGPSDDDIMEVDMIRPPRYRS